ncbi:MAG: acyl-CoA thioesterase [Spirochaetaceae bacterium]|nr:acyl-CoA thioesterase [Spirochaetaceae bacterium]
MKTTFKLRVRTYECDGYNHVNNAVYLQYLEAARHEFLKEIGIDYKGLISKGYGTYTARIEIDYKKSAFADDELTIESRPIKKGAVSGVIEQIITRADDIIASAKVTWVFVDKTGTPVKIPPEFDVEGMYP